MPFKNSTIVLIIMLALSSSAAWSQKKIDAEGHQWWQHAVFYELYPAVSPTQQQRHRGSQRHHLKAGLSPRASASTPSGSLPFFPSPQVDFGYDISDYENIDPSTEH